MTFRNMDEVREANQAAGQYFFEPDTLRFFGSRISENLYNGRFFVTSERDYARLVDHPSAWSGQRRYTVREALPNGHIETIGEFGQYASRSGAHHAARQLGRRDG